MDIPVYLFTGFLESGKTKFIQETLEDIRFNNGERTLLLVCEEGFEEYCPQKFSGKNVFIEILQKDSLKKEYLERLLKENGADRVIIEYNGMWLLSELFDNLPKTWVIAQEFMFADATTFENYNSNMRSLVVDKLNTCELVVFNRFNGSIDKMVLHKIVRATNRRCNIAYEAENGDVIYDDIEDPLPFDVNSPVITIEDSDYALWYRDLSENLDRYNGKTVKFKGIAAKHQSMPKKCFVIGRPVMTCCADDIQFAGLACDYEGSDSVENRQWVYITAQLAVRKHKAYGGTGPVLNAISVSVTTPPESEVATFF